MKKLIILLILAISLGAGMIGAMPGISQAQVVPPAAPYATGAPWIGVNTPWVYYNGDWFLNGILYSFWPSIWMGPVLRLSRNLYRQTRPLVWSEMGQVVSRPSGLPGKFPARLPNWREHQVGRHYGEEFYNRYHPGQGGGWHHGVPGHGPGRP